MIKKTLLFLTIFSLLFLFSGCVQRELVVTQPNIKHVQEGGWADQTNLQEQENIDVSDLDENVTETETNITQEVKEEKMARISFPVEEYNRLPKTGKGTVKGAIYVKDAYDKRVAGTGTRLYLNPVTSYSDQWYEESYLGGSKMEKADQRLFNYLRFTASDSSGNFAFYGVPTGKYYLIGTVTCGTECGYDSAKSIRIATQVTIVGNQVVQKDLSRMVE
jgi:hypothetical protein